MKRCAACGRTYPDDQNFCLDDGTTLVFAPTGGFDSSDAPTQNYPYRSNAAPTEIMQGTPTTDFNRSARTSPPPPPPPPQQQQQYYQTPYAPPKRSPLPWVIGGATVLLLGVAAVVLLTTRGSSEGSIVSGSPTPQATSTAKATPSPLVSPTATPDSGSMWQTVNGDGFSVQMPGKPEKSEQSTPSAAGPLPIVLYTLSHGYEGYIVGYSEYPDIVFQTDEETLLDGARDGAIENVKGEVTSERAITVAGHTGREIIGTSPSSNIGFTARVFLAKPRMYMLVYTQYDKSKPISAHGKTFLDSFQITKH
jgi:hypothetical protein